MAEIELKTAPADFRFPTTNQTRHCFTRYIEFHRCLAAKGEESSECQRFAKYYRSLCPGEWIKEDVTERERGRSDRSRSRSRGREGERESSSKSKGDWIVEVEGDGGRRRVTGLDRSHGGRQQVDWTGSKSRLRGGMSRGRMGFSQGLFNQTSSLG
ncbi:unnamed protein product [Camellia sinensis]